MPVDVAEHFAAALADVPVRERVRWKRHKVRQRRGDLGDRRELQHHDRRRFVPPTTCAAIPFVQAAT